MAHLKYCKFPYFLGILGVLDSCKHLIRVDLLDFERIYNLIYLCSSEARKYFTFTSGEVWDFLSSRHIDTGKASSFHCTSAGGQRQTWKPKPTSPDLKGQFCLPVDMRYFKNLFPFSSQIDKQINKWKWLTDSIRYGPTSRPGRDPEEKKQN